MYAVHQAGFDTQRTQHTHLFSVLSMQDGRLLKPTRPAMSHDLTFVQRAFMSGGPKGDVWVGYTVVSDVCIYICTV